MLLTLCGSSPHTLSILYLHTLQNLHSLSVNSLLKYIMDPSLTFFKPELTLFWFSTHTPRHHLYSHTHGSSTHTPWKRPLTFCWPSAHTLQNLHSHSADPPLKHCVWEGTHPCSPWACQFQGVYWESSQLGCQAESGQDRPAESNWELVSLGQQEGVCVHGLLERSGWKHMLKGSHTYMAQKLREFWHFSLKKQAQKPVIQLHRGTNCWH